MKNITKQIDAKTLSDLILLLVIVVGAIVYFQYSTEIQNEVSDMMYHPLQELKNSIAELDAPRR
ncbi:hypothetical protein [Maribacter aestuarii]|uniref:hypothetical protein n=1 Tax=Maribacter aestuarii TaxID=1130723 RepID=UPI00248D1464|nr:hypothetical protein [Maribacter aestuarii]